MPNEKSERRTLITKVRTQRVILRLKISPVLEETKSETAISHTHATGHYNITDIHAP